MDSPASFRPEQEARFHGLCRPLAPKRLKGWTGPGAWLAMPPSPSRAPLRSFRDEFAWWLASYEVLMLLVSSYCILGFLSCYVIMFWTTIIQSIQFFTPATPWRCGRTSPFENKVLGWLRSQACLHLAAGFAFTSLYSWDSTLQPDNWTLKRYPWVWDPLKRFLWVM